MTSAAALYRNQADIDFRTWWKRGAVLSVIMVVIAGGAWLINGLNLGIEFEGGVSWEFRADDLSTADVRDGLEAVGHVGVGTDDVSEPVGDVADRIGERRRAGRIVVREPAPRLGIKSFCERRKLFWIEGKARSHRMTAEFDQ